MKTLVQRSIELLTHEGYAAVALDDRRKSFSFIHIVGIRHRPAEVLGVSVVEFAFKELILQQIVELSDSYIWTLCGNRLQVHAWEKKKSFKHDEPYQRWKPTIIDVKPVKPRIVPRGTTV